MRLLAVLLAFLAPAACAQPLYLGILNGADVRVAFQFDAGKWTPAPVSGYAANITWIIAFDGRNLGTVASVPLEKPADRTQTGLQRLTPESQSSVQSKIPRARNLVVVSRPNYQDPDQWKPYAPEPNASVLSLARTALSKLAQKQPGEPCDCPGTMVRILPKPYRSSHGDILIGVAPVHDACECHLSEDWFLIRSGQAVTVRSIYQGEQSLHLIDAGDYDACGVSQLVFFEEGVGDGPDKFVLFSPRDALSAEFKIPGPYAY